jgi:hypothetical protein
VIPRTLAGPGLLVGVEEAAKASKFYGPKHIQYVYTQAGWGPWFWEARCGRTSRTCPGPGLLLVVVHRRMSSPIIRPGPALLWIDQRARTRGDANHACMPCSH